MAEKVVRLDEEAGKVLLQAREELVDQLAALVAGMQVPMSLGVPLGSAREPLVSILHKVNGGFGWVDRDQVRAYLDGALG